MNMTFFGNVFVFFRWKFRTFSQSISRKNAKIFVNLFGENAKFAFFANFAFFHESLRSMETLNVPDFNLYSGNIYFSIYLIIQ